MRLGLALVLFLAACTDDRLPDFATGEPPYGYDAAAARPLDGGVALDGSMEAAASDAASAD